MTRWLLGLMLVAFGCATSVEVTTEAAPEVDISRLASFTQAPRPPEDPDAPRYTDALGLRIQREIARALEARGYRPALGSADFDVAFVVSGEPRSRMIDAGDPDANYQIEERYVEGILVIDAFDTRTGEHLWHGRGQTKLFSSGRLIGTNLERAAVDTVRAILAEFPRHKAEPAARLRP